MVKNVCSPVIYRLCGQTKKEDITIACLYCKFLHGQEQAITKIMRSILKQLVGTGASRKISGGPRREKWDSWQRSATCRSSKNIKASYSFATRKFHLYQCAWLKATRYCRACGITKRYCSGFPRTRIFLAGRSHAIIRYYYEMRLDRNDKPVATNDDLAGCGEDYSWRYI